MSPPAPVDPPAAQPDAQPFMAHLEDLRRMLIRSLLALSVGMLAALPLTPLLMRLLRRPLAHSVPHPEAFLQSLEVNGAMSLALSLTFWSGLLLSMPALLYFLAQFVFPGLTARERRLVLRASGFAALLFALGVLLGYSVALPTALSVMFSLNAWLGTQAQWTAGSYINFALQLLLAFGLVFELPILLLILGRLGVVRAAQLRQWRRHAIVGALIIGMVLTPSTDVFSQLVMALPLCGLYEVCIHILGRWERREPG